MQKDYTILSGKNAMLESGILKVYFEAFSSKNEPGTILINNCVQSYSVDFRCCSFTGKERDEETGFGYFGARYMDHEILTSFLSVDRYADKYPFISPYAYCAWNPIKLTDPTGDTVIVPDDKDRAFINALLQQKIDGKKNPLYNKAFADKYKDLDSSAHHYVFESWEYDASRSESGEFQAKSDYSTVKFTRGETPETKMPELGASEYRVLFEETYHAWKFQDNDCKPVTQTCLTEAEAWQFSTKAPGTKFYDNNKMQTIMGRIHNASIKQVAQLLHDGFPTRPPYGTYKGAHGLRALYSHLPLGY